ncbi:transposase [Pseudonocardia sp. GCM10023141]|uniref:transposase n=1 Tax=Pseudonocardia sp. GCM10023141 TaxID=3252653 RepID=UPI00361B9800
MDHLFPYLPHQPGYHQRLVAAAPLIQQAIQALATQVPSHTDQLRLIDATPVPCGTSRETVKRSELAGWASYGYCASYSRFYWGLKWGLKLYLVTTLEGMPVVWCLADPKIGERDVATDLLGHAHDLRALPRGAVVIGDKGFAGREFEHDMTQLGIVFVRPDRRDETRRHGNLAPIRQRIESIFATAKRQLSLELHGARTAERITARVGQRLLALAGGNSGSIGTDGFIGASVVAGRAPRWTSTLVTVRSGSHLCSRHVELSVEHGVGPTAGTASRGGGRLGWSGGADSRSSTHLRFRTCSPAARPPEGGDRPGRAADPLGRRLPGNEPRGGR